MPWKMRNNLSEKTNALLYKIKFTKTKVTDINQNHMVNVYILGVNCRTGWISTNDSRSCYLFSNDSRDWTGAQVLILLLSGTVLFEDW